MDSELISAIVFVLTAIAAVIALCAGAIVPAILLAIISRIAFWGADFNQCERYQNRHRSF